jgi:hypothetical protein
MNQAGKVIIVLAFALAGCSHQSRNAVKEEKQSSGMAGSRPAMDQRVNVAPQRCRIVATILAIDNELLKQGDSPCAKVPCNASARVDSILGYGSSFGNPLAIGETIMLHFAFTLSPNTKEFFPTMSENYPGLVIGSQFSAEIESQPEVNSPARRQFIVYSYRKTK